FPGKILGYLDAQIPILGSVNKGNDVIQIINDSGAGKVVVNGNDDNFYIEAYRIFKSKAIRNRMSSRSKNPHAKCIFC
ncbi:glycosyltransferase WbuB, partial [Alphaproteobacteria bacterium]|nr:glycosyltransferase WbuB [Alphaproteobacteria bacterium]